MPAKAQTPDTHAYETKSGYTYITKHPAYFMYAVICTIVKSSERDVEDQTCLLALACIFLNASL
jgi:hypothetical protein